MLIEDNFFPDPKEHPSTITVPEICERFKTAGLPCRSVRHRDEARIVFEGRKSDLVFTVNSSGHATTASLPEEVDYDVAFAAVIFEVFDSIGWTYAPD